MLDDESKIQKAAGTMAICFIAFFGLHNDHKMELLNTLGDKILPILYSDEQYLQFTACWAFAWLGNTNSYTPVHHPEMISRLFEIWSESEASDIQYVASWAIKDMSLIDRELKPLPEPNQDQIDFIKQQIKLDNIHKSSASLKIAFYWKTPWSDEELAKMVASDFGLAEDSNQFNDILIALGEPGEAQLKDLKQKKVKNIKF